MRRCWRRTLRRWAHAGGRTRSRRHCRGYLEQLAAARRGEAGAQHRYRWMVLELVDQLARHQTGECSRTLGKIPFQSLILCCNALAQKGGRWLILCVSVPTGLLLPSQTRFRWGSSAWAARCIAGCTTLFLLQSCCACAGLKTCAWCAPMNRAGMVLTAITSTRNQTAACASLIPCLWRRAKPGLRAKHLRLTHSTVECGFCGGHKRGWPRSFWGRSIRNGRDNWGSPLARAPVGAVVRGWPQSCALR